MRIGILVATELEKAPFLEVFGQPDFTDMSYGREVLTWNSERHTICLLCSGYGEIAATSATQFLIDKFYVDGIINYGVAGGLSENQSIGEVGQIRRIVHYGFDVSGDGKYPIGRYPNQSSIFIKPNDVLPFWAISRALGNNLSSLSDFTCASADKFVCGGEPKRRLREKFDADICEMEAAGIVITCNNSGVPCSFIKAISDGVDEDKEAFEKNVHEASKKCVIIIKKVLKVL